MAGRRLTISALLCGDEQPQDGPQPHGSTSSHSTPFTPSVTVPSRSDVVSGDLRGGQDGGSSSVESHDNAFRTSIPSPHISRVSHNPVSLSLQPVHHRTQSSSLPSGDDPIAHHNLRGGHPGNEPVRLETPANASRSPLVSAVSPERDFASYHNFHSLPQTTPRPISTPRRSSDPRGSSFRSVEGSSYFARPRSGTSAHSDPLASAAAYTFPPPLPPQSPSYSAHQSSSTFFTSQSLPSPSRSPIFGRQPVRSPSQLLNSMSRTSPRGEDEQHSPSQHSPGPFSGPALASGSGSPLLVREEPLSARPSRVRSASHNQSGSPPSGKPHTPGAAALPNLLNAEPPRSPAIPFGSHASPGGLGALEALVQVATEERRRLSGELPTPLERRESARKASLSPVLNRHPPPLPQASLSPVLQRSPPLPSPRHDARVSSLGFISLGQPHPHDGEPPSKKRRRTDSTASGAAPAPPATAPSLPAPPTPLAAASVKPRSISQLLVTEPEPSNTRPVESIPELQLPPPSSDPPSAPTVIREAEEISPPAEEKAAVSHIRAEEKPIEAESNQAISNTREKTPSEEKQEEAVKVEEPSVALSVSSPEGVVLEPVPDTLPDTMPDASVDVPPVIKVQGPREQSEPDPHEWLLEHYATDSPAAAPVRHSPIPEGPPDTPELSAASPLPMLKEEGELLAESLPTEPLPAKDAKSKIVEAPSRTPTPLALLEAELDRSTPDERIITSSAVSPTSDADLAMELDLAADASEQPAAVKKDTSAKDELDDELLSLLDDTPRHSHSHSHPSTKASHAPSSSSRAEQLPVAKEAQVKKPSTTPAPRPLSVTPAPSDRVVMPPPIAPPGQASKSTANDQPAATKSEKAETPSASSSMKKKEPSAKVSYSISMHA
ncbi:hypothetical protein FKP32DRAFT_778514 [Trametes sanguinea]|nr:hypothetical protein FKP32DRAFT_778514 [Trametes sanguinea]